MWSLLGIPGRSPKVTTFRIVFQANDEQDDGQMAAKCCPDDHCYVGLFSRPNSDESIIRSEEIHKHCRLKVMLANIFIALNPHLLSLPRPMLYYCLVGASFLIVLMT